LSNQDTTDKQVGLARELEENRQQLMTHQSTRKQLVAESSQIADEHTQVLKQARSWGVVTSAKQTNVSVEAIDRDEIARLEAELTLMGEIDETLVETHRELAERVGYLENQAHDMQRAVADLETILTELERRIKTTFQGNFAKINTAFGKHFAQLFGGGTAALTLTPLDDGSYGIEISVRPPAKRLTALSALSGGEKALSAIALLAAILDINPSPFVVLDEVDAALDDHNAQLFQKTLARLAKRSQILVITHNHETMVHADRLYGVTASPRTASTVLTVDLTTVEAGA
jgi:chromosome segregation protein